MQRIPENVVAILQPISIENGIAIRGSENAATAAPKFPQPA